MQKKVDIKFQDYVEDILIELEKKAFSVGLKETMNLATHRILTLAYTYCGYNTSLCAEYLQIKRTTLTNMLQKYGITQKQNHIHVFRCKQCNKTIRSVYGGEGKHICLK